MLSIAWSDVVLLMPAQRKVRTAKKGVCIKLTSRRGFLHLHAGVNVSLWSLVTDRIFMADGRFGGAKRTLSPISGRGQERDPPRKMIATATGCLPPEILELRWRQLGVTHRMLD